MLRAPGLGKQADCSALQWHDRHLPGSRALSKDPLKNSFSPANLQQTSTKPLHECCAAGNLGLFGIQA